MELHYGRPENEAGRMANEIAVYDFLDRLGVEYWQVDHPAAMTMEDCKEVDEALDAMVCKNLVLCNRQQTVFYLLMVAGAKRFQTKELSKQLGVSRLSFAGEEHLRDLLDVTPGSVSVMCLMHDPEQKVQLLVDKSVQSTDYIGFHPCINTSSLRVSQQALWNKILPALNRDYILVDLPAAE